MEIGGDRDNPKKIKSMRLLSEVKSLQTKIDANAISMSMPYPDVHNFYSDPKSWMHPAQKTQRYTFIPFCQNVKKYIFLSQFIFALSQLQSILFSQHFL